DVVETLEAREPGARVLGGRADENEAPLGPDAGGGLKEVEVDLLRGQIPREADHGPRKRTHLARSSVRMREVGEVGAVANQVRLRVPRQLALIEAGRRRKDD